MKSKLDFYSYDFLGLIITMSDMLYSVINQVSSTSMVVSVIRSTEHDVQVYSGKELFKFSMLNLFQNL